MPLPCNGDVSDDLMRFWRRKGKQLTAPMITIVFPATLSSGREGEMASYVSLCQLETGAGKGGCMMGDG
jgi:hypothetical protein